MATRRLSIEADFETNTKECSWCHVVQPTTSYCKCAASKDGFQGPCKTCQAKYRSEHYPEYREQKIAYATQWNKEHPELRKKYNATWLENNLEDQHARRSAASQERYWKDPEMWRTYYADQAWKNNLWKRFGWSVDDYMEMLEAQGGVCAICRKTCRSGKRLAVDHDHACCEGPITCGKCVRGLLCAKCNGSLGMLDDDIDLLATAMAYLEFHRATV